MVEFQLAENWSADSLCPRDQMQEEKDEKDVSTLDEDDEKRLKVHILQQKSNP